MTEARKRFDVNEREYLAEGFEAHRGHLRAVAYRILGSVSEADDAVQESWLRLARSDTAAVENLGGWLTTVVARVCLDMLRSRKSRSEEPFGPHVPEPIISREEVDPEQEALLADSVGLALLVVLELLASRSRASRPLALTTAQRGLMSARSFDWLTAPPESFGVVTARFRRSWVPILPCAHATPPPKTTNASRVTITLL